MPMTVLPLRTAWPTTTMNPSSPAPFWTQWTTTGSVSTAHPRPSEATNGANTAPAGPNKTRTHPPEEPFLVQATCNYSFFFHLFTLILIEAPPITLPWMIISPKPSALRVHWTSKLQCSQAETETLKSRCQPWSQTCKVDWESATLTCYAHPMCSQKSDSAWTWTMLLLTAQQRTSNALLPVPSQLLAPLIKSA